jgi:chromosome segregation ATPase
MVDNARAKLTAIDQRSKELQGLVDKKVEQCRAIEFAVEQTEHAYEQADRAYGELGSRITRETIKLDVAKNTPAEVERTEILASVVKACDEAQGVLAQAVTARDEARTKQGLAVAIMEEIEEHVREINDLGVLRREYQAVLEQVHAQKGSELAQRIADNIIATRDSYEAYEQELKERRSAHEAATRQIDSLRDEYHELAKELWASHGHFLHSEPEMTHGQFILEAQRAYILAMLEHESQARIWILDHHQKFADALTLDPSIVQDLMKGTWMKKRTYDAWGRETEEGKFHHPRLELIDKLIKDERQNITRRSVNW